MLVRVSYPTYNSSSWPQKWKTVNKETQDQGRSHASLQLLQNKRTGLHTLKTLVTIKAPDI
jgi:hypothetical protein